VVSNSSSHWSGKSGYYELGILATEGFVQKSSGRPTAENMTTYDIAINSIALDKCESHRSHDCLLPKQTVEDYKGIDNITKNPSAHQINDNDYIMARSKTMTDDVLDDKTHPWHSNELYIYFTT
jgi:hypothetical protein